MLASGAVTTSSVQADTTNSVQDTQNVNTEQTINEAWTNKLAKAGYTFKLAKGAGKDSLYPELNAKPYSKKYVQKLVKKNVVFKIDQAKEIKNGSFVHLVSKNGKYHGWTDFASGVYNKRKTVKALKPLIKAEKKVISATDTKKAEQYFGKAKKLAAKLTGHNKKLAKTSIKQLQEWLNSPTYANLPVLLIGSL